MWGPHDLTENQRTCLSESENSIRRSRCPGRTTWTIIIYSEKYEHVSPFRLSKTMHHGTNYCDALLGKLPSLPPVHMLLDLAKETAVVCPSPASWTCPGPSLIIVPQRSSAEGCHGAHWPWNQYLHLIRCSFRISNHWTILIHIHRNWAQFL